MDLAPFASAHFVPINERTGTPLAKWKDSPLDLDTAAARIRKGALIAAVPRTLGCVVFDLDDEDADTRQAQRERIEHIVGAPPLIVSSSRSGKSHLWYLSAWVGHRVGLPGRIDVLGGQYAIEPQIGAVLEAINLARERGDEAVDAEAVISAFKPRERPRMEPRGAELPPADSDRLRAACEAIRAHSGTMHGDDWFRVLASISRMPGATEDHARIAHGILRAGVESDRGEADTIRRFREAGDGDVTAATFLGMAWDAGFDYRAGGPRRERPDPRQGVEFDAVDKGDVAAMPLRVDDLSPEALAAPIRATGGQWGRDHLRNAIFRHPDLTDGPGDWESIEARGERNLTSRIGAWLRERVDFPVVRGRVLKPTAGDLAQLYEYLRGGRATIHLLVDYVDRKLGPATAADLDAWQDDEQMEFLTIYQCPDDLDPHDWREQAIRVNRLAWFRLTHSAVFAIDRVTNRNTRARYSGFLPHVCIVGAGNTGKSLLARELLPHGLREFWGDVELQFDRWEEVKRALAGRFAAEIAEFDLVGKRPGQIDQIKSLLSGDEFTYRPLYKMPEQGFLPLCVITSNSARPLPASDDGAILRRIAGLRVDPTSGNPGPLFCRTMDAIRDSRMRAALHLVREGGFDFDADASAAWTRRHLTPAEAEPLHVRARLDKLPEGSYRAGVLRQLCVDAAGGREIRGIRQVYEAAGFREKRTNKARMWAKGDREARTVTTVEEARALIADAAVDGFES
ncbi:MAG: hypothetical protein F4Y04_05320 [Chloroflexi bacterium]|nr:hypothetical protein [Chloroflexota bacterium]